GIVLVPGPCLGIVEVGNDREVVVAVGERGIRPEAVATDLRNAARPRGQRVGNRPALGRRGLGLELQTHDVAEHRYNNAASAPPSTANALPVTKPAASEHRNAATAPKSAASPSLCAGTVAARSSRPGPLYRFESRSVRCNPGSSEFTVTPS